MSLQLSQQLMLLGFLATVQLTKGLKQLSKLSSGSFLALKLTEVGIALDIEEANGIRTQYPNFFCFVDLTSNWAHASLWFFHPFSAKLRNQVYTNGCHSTGRDAPPWEIVLVKDTTDVRRKDGDEKMPPPDWIWSHDLLIPRHLFYHCAATASLES